MAKALLRKTTEIIKANVAVMIISIELRLYTLSVPHIDAPSLPPKPKKMSPKIREDKKIVTSNTSAKMRVAIYFDSNILVRLTGRMSRSFIVPHENSVETMPPAITMVKKMTKPTILELKSMKSINPCIGLFLTLNKTRAAMRLMARMIPIMTQLIALLYIFIFSFWINGIRLYNVLTSRHF